MISSELGTYTKRIIQDCSPVDGHNKLKVVNVSPDSKPIWVLKEDEYRAMSLVMIAGQRAALLWLFLPFLRKNKETFESMVHRHVVRYLKRRLANVWFNS